VVGEMVAGEGDVAVEVQEELWDLLAAGRSLS